MVLRSGKVAKVSDFAVAIKVISSFLKFSLRKRSIRGGGGGRYEAHEYMVIRGVGYLKQTPFSHLKLAKK